VRGVWILKLPYFHLHFVGPGEKAVIASLNSGRAAYITGNSSSTTKNAEKIRNII